ncbi:histidine--tRNA ligase [Desulfogranum japonicum]|uniref:histidine--tRNA ligase n=1 Tax=Desulfogranum japonicum TaxID=231447 RepID=UPI00040263D9|nr:histidine--tRNA ligase [Desulfogranum japonicum]
MKIQAINGFKDILPENVLLWQHIEKKAREVFQRFGLREIRIPILEKTELFVRSIGEATDVVEKEMYTFPEAGLTMRPEATAGIMRAFIEHGLHVQQPIQRLYAIGPMFRHERPQKGRQRQFHQLDTEIIGSVDPQIDAELISMGQMLLDELGITTSLEINSIGCSQCRPPYRQKLVSFLESRHDDLCEDCKRRTYTNPLRVLDCKKSTCREIAKDAPSLLEEVCDNCKGHFNQVQASLDRMGITYTLNRFMVRGLDYYTQTTFEFLTDDLGAQSAVGAGGRYDGLIEQLGGPALPGIGFAMGMERLALLLEQQNNRPHMDSEMDLFLAALGPQSMDYCETLVHKLRKKGIRAAMDYSGRSLKAQMKQANRFKASFTLIIGDNELLEQTGIIRNMSTQEQQPIGLDTNTDQLSNVLAEIVR